MKVKIPKMINNKSELKKINLDLFNVLEALFSQNNSAFPCLFGRKSFQKDCMKYGISREHIDFNVISSDLIHMSELIKNETSVDKRKYLTYLHAFPTVEHGSLSDFFFELIEGLHKIDPKDWPENKTKSYMHHDFEFCFNGLSWFPVLLTPWHDVEIRKCPITIIGFQPLSTFEYNKKNHCDEFELMRKSIHGYIDRRYGDKKPEYMSANSSGSNITQFLGNSSIGLTSEDKVGSVCPFSKRKLI